MLKEKPQLTEGEKERFEKISYNRIYQQLLKLEGIDEVYQPLLDIVGKGIVVEAITPLGQVIYIRDYVRERINLISLGYKIEKNKQGNEIYVRAPKPFKVSAKDYYKRKEL